MSLLLLIWMGLDLMSILLYYAGECNKLMGNRAWWSITDGSEHTSVFAKTFSDDLLFPNVTPIRFCRWF